MKTGIIAITATILLCGIAQADLLTANDSGVTGWSTWSALGGGYTEGDYTVNEGPYGAASNGGIRTGLGDIDGTAHFYMTDSSPIAFQRTDGGTFDLTSLSIANASASANTLYIYKNRVSGSLGELVDEISFSGNEVKTDLVVSGLTGVENVTFWTSTNNGYLFGIDNVSVAVPEPATLGLAVVFGGGILFVRRIFMI
ncbi:hypothetical protein P4C99_16750 [Pontiellaceae bacterium B1224]|nr:hypothetical protein [Pontiellaceae bacterium B1224]